MKTKRFTAWRCLHPDLDRLEGEHSGLQISSTGGIDTVSEHASIRQAVLLLLSTSPGERIMRPRYGCELKRLIFAPNNDTTAGLAIHYVRQALRRWEPRINVTRVDANRYENDEGHLYIELDYQVRATGQEDSIIYRVNLNGGLN